MTHPSTPPFGTPPHWYGALRPAAGPPASPPYTTDWPAVPPAQPVSRRRYGAPLAAVLLAVVVAVAGTGLYFASRGGASAAASASLVDPDTVDPCGLVGADEFRYLDADVQIQPSDFDSCAVTLIPRADAASDGGTLRLVVTVGRGVDPDGIRAALGATTASTAGALHIIKQTKPIDAPSCEQLIYQPDGIGATIAASLGSSPGDVPSGVGLCDLASRVTAGAVAAIQHNRLAHLRYPADSVGRLSLCAGLTTADAKAALPVPGLVARPALSRHSCGWTVSTALNSPGIVVYAKLATPTGWAEEQKYSSATATIAGRHTVISKSDAGQAATFCIGATAGKTWPRWPGRIVFGGSEIRNRVPADARAGATGLVEEVDIGVTPARGETAEHACRAMRSLAAELWRNLPPLSR